MRSLSEVTFKVHEKCNQREKNGEYGALYDSEILPNLQSRMKDFKNMKMLRESMMQDAGVDKIQVDSRIKQFCVEFANKSSLHGFNQLAASHRHTTERILTGSVILTAFIGLIMMSVTFWLRYRNMAVITVLDHDYQTFKITKPSLIICPMDNIDEAKINDTFKRYGVKDTRETREFFRFLSTATYENMAEAPEYEDVAPEKWLLILHDLQKPISTEKEIINVDKTIKPIVTERGICLMKDSYVSVYSSLDYWMANNWTTVEIPQILNYYTYETRNEIVDFKLSYNFTISLSDPRDIMDYNRVFYEIRNLQTINMKYEIFEVFSSEKVKALSVYQRKCKFMSNGGLRMWPEYRYSMCVTECRYTKIKQLCGCYPHFARPIDDTPVCGTKQFQCIGKYVAEIVSLSKEVLRGCNCILDCDIVSYEPEDINVVVWREGGLIKGLVSRVAIDFPRDKYFRKVLYGLYDFLGSVGGAAGLLLGASVLSFIEIIYFLTFRLCNQEYVTTKLNRKQRMSKMKGYNKKVNMWEMEKNEEILYVNKKD